MTPAYLKIWAEPLAELHQELTMSRISDDAVVHHPCFQGFVHRYVGSFWKRNQGMVQEYSRNLDAEDLFAVASCACLNGLRSYQPKYETSLLEWLRLKMYQACHGHVRENYVFGRAGRNSSRAPDVNLFSLDMDEHSLLESEASGKAGGFADPLKALHRQVVQDAVSRLPEPCRQVVRLRHFENHSFAEIGALLRPERPLNKGTVQRIYTRALNYLKDELQ